MQVATLLIANSYNSSSLFLNFDLRNNSVGAFTRESDVNKMFRSDNFDLTSFISSLLDTDVGAGVEIDGSILLDDAVLWGGDELMSNSKETR